ncbi:energy transducer TonB [Phenylobacterium immobile]|uniref:energy transducer TonB n=1 Tax=Phenylobacterium immobile TaxID=21 RepID=UPI000A93396E|nr:energy transducer TonB [Phenylobacterium immobile]
MRGRASANSLVWTATAAVHGLAAWGLALNLAPKGVFLDPPVMSVELAEVLGGEVRPRQAALPPVQQTEVLKDPHLDAPIQRYVSVAPPEPAAAQSVGPIRSQVAAAPQGAAEAAPAPPVAPASRQGVAHGLDADAPHGPGRDYSSRLRSWLEAHKTYPRRARMRHEEGVVQVRFVLDRDGHVLDGGILHTSGHPTLDAEVLAMLVRADPFPPAPHHLAGDRIEIAAPVEFFLQN